MSVDLLVADRLVQARTKGIAAQNADDKGIAGRAERLGRPFDEAREVVQKNGLNLIFRRRIGRKQAVIAIPADLQDAGDGNLGRLLRQLQLVLPAAG